MKYHVILVQIFIYGNLPKSFFTKCAKKIHPAFVQSLCRLWIVCLDDPSDFVSLPALGEKIKKVYYIVATQSLNPLVACHTVFFATKPPGFQLLSVIEICMCLDLS